LQHTKNVLKIGKMNTKIIGDIDQTHENSGLFESKTRRTNSLALKVFFNECRD
jgi:hypothetical protein